MTDTFKHEPKLLAEDDMKSQMERHETDTNKTES